MTFPAQLALSRVDERSVAEATMRPLNPVEDGHASF
jgi:hypothetical protein